MLETPEELDRLQNLLDASMASAGPHLRDIISDERRLGARQLTERLHGLCLLVLATATADGRPLAGPVDGYFLHGTFWFSSGTQSVRMRHLAARPAVSATYLPGEELAVTVHGRVECHPMKEPAAPSCGKRCSTSTCPSRDRPSRSGSRMLTPSGPGSSRRRSSPSVWLRTSRADAARRSLLGGVDRGDPPDQA